jgi:prepilin-type N-terminal cleavage/methylation domain-containing protein
MTARRLLDERGLTLIELLIALIVFSAVMAGGLSFLRSQGRAMSLGDERMAALQNLRFALESVEKDLRTAGIGVPDEQPFLVYAGSDVVAFNADLVSSVANDVSAVYYDPDAPAGSVTGMSLLQRTALPRTAFVYPDTTYTVAGGTNSPAETVILFFSPDSTTERPDDYLLLRQVNNARPEVVSRNVLRTPGAAFFQYYRLVTPTTGPVYLDTVRAVQLPLQHSVKSHLSSADTAQFALIDSVRAVRLALTVTNGLTETAERRRSLARLIHLVNGGLAARKTCGDAPLLGTGLTASVTTLGAGAPVVMLGWNAATDEFGGETDVERYVIWRRRASEPVFTDPYLSIPAGNPTYSYTDAAVASGESYVYALAAQDCTPSLSPRVTIGPVSVP